MSTNDGIKGGFIGSSRVVEEYQEFIKATKWYEHAGEKTQREVNYLILGLAGETGEVADYFKKIVREAGMINDAAYIQLMADGGTDKLLDELGDVAWYFFNLLDTLGINLETLLIQNAYKLHQRLQERHYTGQDNEPGWPFSNPVIDYEAVKAVHEGQYEEDNDGKL